MAALRDLLERERFADFFPGALPIVSLSVAIDDFPTLDQKLTRAFDASLVLSIQDRGWADALIELMSQSAGVATADYAASAEALRAPSVIPDSTRRPESLESDIGPTPHAVEEPAVVGRTAGAGRPLITRRCHATPAALAFGAASALVAAVVALAVHGSAIPNDAVRPPVEAAALVVPPIAATPTAAVSLSRLSAAVRHPRRPAVRRVRCADWLHQNRPGGSDYHGPQSRDAATDTEANTSGRPTRAHR